MPPNFVAALLRHFLKNLKEPIFGYKNYEKILNLQKIEDQNGLAVLNLKEILKSLSPVEYAITNAVLKLMVEVDTYNDKMKVRIFKFKN